MSISEKNAATDPASLSADFQYLELDDELFRSFRTSGDYSNRGSIFDKNEVIDPSSLSADLRSLERDENGLILGPVRFFSKLCPCLVDVSLSLRIVPLVHKSSAILRSTNHNLDVEYQRGLAVVLVSFQETNEDVDWA